jgi:hypothetical protein
MSVEMIRNPAAAAAAYPLDDTRRGNGLRRSDGCHPSQARPQFFIVSLQGQRRAPAGKGDWPVWFETLELAQSVLGVGLVTLTPATVT